MRQPEYAGIPGSSAEAGGSTSGDVIGRIVGHYQIISELGRGGMGVVYRARDLGLGRTVALKTPLPGHSSPPDRRQFLREAQATARLSHPNIVPIFEVLEDGGELWVAMELVDGRSFKTLLHEGGALQAAEIIRYAEALADALQAAHSKGLLHRDINPNNIMLASDGRPLLMDFGLAQFFMPAAVEAQASTHTTDPNATDSGRAAGTPAYMPPEQILGKPVDVRSDVFSLGAVLYEVCTGRPPFAAPDRLTLYDAILNHEPASIQRQNRSIPPELERAIRKALAKRADERYQSAAELAADLRALRRQIESGHVTLPLRFERRLRIRPLPAVLASVVVTALLGLWLWRAMASDPVPVGSPTQITSLIGWESEPVVSPDGSLIAYTSNESGNADIWIVDALGGGGLRLTDDPAADRHPAWYPDGSAVAFESARHGRPGIWKVPRLGGTPTLLVANAADATIAPTGDRIAFVRVGASGQHRVYVAPLVDPERILMTTADGDGLWDHSSPAWSPDGQLICYAAARDLWLIPSAGGKASRLTSDNQVDFEPAWSHDGRYVYFSSYREGTLALWRVSSKGGAPQRLTGGTGPERHPSISHDGTRLAYTTFLGDPDLVLRDLATGVEQQFPGLRDEHAPTFSPDGRAIAFISDRLGGRYDLWLQPLAGNSPDGPPYRLTDHEGSVAQPAYSADGKWIAYHRVIGTQRDIWIVSSGGGGVPTRFTDDPAADLHPDWSPDGSQIVFVSERGGGSHLWTAPVRNGRPDGPAKQLTSGRGDDQAPSWSPDGSLIAFVRTGTSGESDVWTVEAGGGEPLQWTQGAETQRIRWSHTSTLLFVSGLWGSDTLKLRRVPRGGGSAFDFDPPITMDTTTQFGHFDITRDGRLLVFARANLRGDIWLLRARTGTY